MGPGVPVVDTGHWLRSAEGRSFVDPPGRVAGIAYLPWRRFHVLTKASSNSVFNPIQIQSNPIQSVQVGLDWISQGLHWRGLCSLAWLVVSATSRRWGEETQVGK